MHYKDSQLLAERYEQVRQDELLNEGIVDALKNKLVDWAMSTVAKTIKQFAPDVYKELKQVGSKEELANMVKQQPVSENWRDYEPGQLMKGGSEGFSSKEMESSAKQTPQAAMPEEAPQSKQEVKSAVEKFMGIVKQTGVTLGKVLMGIGVVITAIAAVLSFANPIGILCGVLYLKLKND